MAFLSVNTEKASQAEGGSDYVTKSGIYNLTLKYGAVENTVNGAVSINYFFDKVNSYGNVLISKTGTPTFGYDILERLAVILGEEELSDPEETTVKFSKTSKDYACIPELTDVPVKAWIQFKYSVYNDKIQEKVVVKRFYRQADGASGSEIAETLEGGNPEIGVRLAKDLEVCEETHYEDGVTAEAVEAWKKAKMDSNGAKPVQKKAATGGFPGAKKVATGFPGAK